YVLLLLYERGQAGATMAELDQWVRPQMRANLGRTVRRLVDDAAKIHVANGRYILTKLGGADVEKRNLHHVREEPPFHPDDDGAGKDLGCSISSTRGGASVFWISAAGCSSSGLRYCLR